MTVSNAVRKLIIESYNNGNGINQISNMFNIKYNICCCCDGQCSFSQASNDQR